MTQLASIDFPNKRIHLHLDTVTQGYDGFLLYDDVRTSIATTPLEQNYPLPIQKEGYVSKGGGKFTPKYVSLRSGWRLVPYDGVSHDLDILVETISDDLISDRDVFDRSGLLIEVNIDAVYPQVEIIEVNTAGGSGASAQELWEYGTRELTSSAGVTAQDINDIADAVWDEPLAGHTTGGTTGEQLSNTAATVDEGAIASAVWTSVSRTLTDAAGVTPQDIIDIADAVWDEDITTHVLSNSAGANLSANLDTSNYADIADAVWTDPSRELTSFVGLNTSDLTAVAQYVWDEPITGNVNIGSFGEKVNDLALSVDTGAIATAVWTSGGRTLSGGVDLSISAENSLAAAVWSDTTRTLTTAPSILAGDLTNIADSVWTRTTRELSGSLELTAPDILAIADAVWEEPLLDHLTLGTAGEALDDAQASVDQNSFVNAIWAAPDRQLTASLAPSSAAIATAVWSQNTRTLTAAPNLQAADIDSIAGAVWTDTTRTLTSSGAPTAGSIAAAVWNNASRTLSASLDPTASAIAAAVWAESSRSLTSGVVLSAAGLTSVQTSVWGATTRSLTTAVDLTGATIANISTDVWSETTRTITGDVNVSATSLGDIEGAVWTATVRDLTSDVSLNSLAINAISDAVWAETTRTLTDTGLTGIESTMLRELWQVGGLDAANPVTNTQTQTTVGTIDIQYTGNSKTAVTSTRQ